MPTQTKKPAKDRFPEFKLLAKDGRTVEVFRRKDKLPVHSRNSTRQGWGWRVRASNGRVTQTNGQPIERHSAVRQATREAGAGAKIVTGS